MGNAVEILKRINYYRLRGYYIHLCDSSSDSFCEGTSFEQIIAIHDFDLSLGHLTAEYLMNIEVAMRTHVAYYHSHKFGALGYRDSSNFWNLDYYNEFISEVNKAVGKSRDLYISHFTRNYHAQYPLWAIVEIISMGTLSKFYSNMFTNDSFQIAKTYYGANDTNLVRTNFKCLVVLRNICAHGGRLYNKPITSNFVIKKVDKPRFSSTSYNTYFAALHAMKYLSPDRQLWVNFLNRLDELICLYGENIDISMLGLVPDWKKLLL